MESYIDYIDPSVEELYTSITNYYQNPVMYKIKDVEQYSLYMAKIESGLMNEHRYIIVFMYKNDEPFRSTSKLGDLKWTTFQTRILNENHDIRSFAYIPKRSSGITSTIELTERTDRYTQYKCEKFPIDITVLNNPNKNDMYQNRSILASALETYRTILTLKA